MLSQALPEPSLRVVTPVSGPQFQENGSIRQRRIGLDDQHAKALADLGSLRDDLSVQLPVNSPASQIRRELFAIRRDTRGIALVYRLQFLVNMNDGPHMLRPIQRRQYSAQDLEGI